MWGSYCINGKILYLLIVINSLPLIMQTAIENNENTESKPTARSLCVADEETSSAYEYPAGIRLVAVLFSLTLGTFLMALDTTIITVAIPKISSEFQSLDQVGWFGSAYLITLTAFQPISSSLYKSFDPKTMYLAFMIVFEGK